MRPWSTQDIEAAKALYVSGEPVSAVAAATGRTKMAIGRMMAKLGIRRSAAVIRTNAIVAHKKVNRDQAAAAQPPRWKPSAAAWAPIPGSTPRPLLCIPVNGCKWPVGEDDNNQLFCCEPRKPTDKAYCAVHRARSIGTP